MTMADVELVVLLGLRLKGFAQAKVVGDFLGLSTELVDECLSKAAEGQRVRFRSTGGRSGWSLTGEGRAYGERLLAAELDRTDSVALVESAYVRFLQLNRPMLAVCTRWQVVDRSIGANNTSDLGGFGQAGVEINDHSDPAYDEAVIGELQEIDARVQPICAELGRQLQRFANYGPRLEFAMDKLRGGNIDWFTKPVIESYHTVWFELHEDLLATLGVDRASEMSEN